MECKKKCLFVDDDPGVHMIADLLFEDKNINLTFCCGGYEAIEQARALEPDLIILDVLMPELNGIETATKIKAIDNLRDTPIIFMTATVDREIEAFALSISALGIIKKPFDPSSFCELIEDLYGKTFT